MNIIFQIDGGIGKNIMATAVCKAIKTQYPNDKLIVVTAYNDVFINNPNVDRCFNFANISYFHEEYIDGKEVKLCLQDPYRQTDFIKREKSLIHIWCEMNMIKYNGEIPEIFLTERERSFYGKQFITEKPLFVMQTNGGAENQGHKYSWARDIPSKNVQEVIEHFKMDYTIAHIRREDQIGYEFTTPIQGNYRSMVVLISMSKLRLFIDSFAQHTASALELPSVVCWIVNSPKVFGYFTNVNIQANEFTSKAELVGSYIDKFDISGNLLQFPYKSEDEIFDTKKIIDSLESLKK